MGLPPIRGELPPIVEAVREAKTEFSNYMTQLEQDYNLRKLWREENKIPVIAFNGYGRAGKDTAARYLSNVVASIHYGGSVSSTVCPLIAYSIGQEESECFEQRHSCREYWFDWCNEFRREDPSLLARYSLAKADVICGIRSDVELFACVAEQVVDLTIWVENPRVPPDITTEYGPEDCDITIHNEGGLGALHQKIVHLAAMLNLHKGNITSFEVFKEKMSNGEKTNPQKTTNQKEGSSKLSPSEQKSASKAEAT